MIAAAIDDAQASASRSDNEPVIVPMGHFCPTAGFLKQLGLRRMATPLDWCRSTLSLWQHALVDNLNELENENHVRCSPLGRTYHALYDSDTFPKSTLWEHGYDAASFHRRCRRLRQVMHSDLCEKLGLHIAFELPPLDALTKEIRTKALDSRRPGEPAWALSHSTSLQEVVTDAIALMQSIERIGNVHKFQLLAVLFCFRESESERLTRVQGVCDEMELKPALSVGCDCFARIDPLPNVTVLRYTVPHHLKNGEGLPLPPDGSELLPNDARRLHAVLKTLYPGFCTTEGTTKAEPQVEAAHFDRHCCRRIRARETSVPPPPTLQAPPPLQPQLPPNSVEEEEGVPRLAALLKEFNRLSQLGGRSGGSCLVLPRHDLECLCLELGDGITLTECLVLLDGHGQRVLLERLKVAGVRKAGTRHMVVKLVAEYWEANRHS
mmetsp:Transcript_74345/g.124067  ORF Transcript_74345/g.124067 Transcript_74345/m.124067 type:complete len:437 (+) Transcript_74345:62-1372(+)